MDSSVVDDLALRQPVDPDSIEGRALALRDRAVSLQVLTAGQYEAGIDYCKRIKKSRREWDDLQRPAIRKAKESHDEALNTFNKIDRNLKEAYETLHARCEAWAEGRREDQRRALEASRSGGRVVERAIEMDHRGDMDLEFDKAVESGDLVKAARIVDQVAGPVIPAAPPMPVPPPPPAPESFIPKIGGVTLADPWTYDIIDESLIPLEYKIITIDKKKIQAEVKRLKGDTKIPGIHPRPDTALRIRA